MVMMVMVVFEVRLGHFHNISFLVVSCATHLDFCHDRVRLVPEVVLVLRAQCIPISVLLLLVKQVISRSNDLLVMLLRLR